MKWFRNWSSIYQKHLILIFFIFYFLFRILILNLNSAEWGDSYRILRATQFLENWEYPTDEKRPPLFSIILLSGEIFGGDVYGGRVVMLFISIAILLVFNSLLKEVAPKFSVFQRFIVLALLGLNPLFVYWSMRIYADSLFLLIVLLAFLILYKYEKYWWQTLLVSFLTILGVYTRFEGYILIATTSLYYLLFFVWKRKVSFLNYFIIYILSTGILLSALINFEFFHYQNPLSSSYFDEAESRSFNFRELGPTFLQLIFVSAGIVGALVMGWEWKKFINFFHSQPLLAIYTSIFVLLSAIWYPAVPRLFLQILPFLVLVFGFCLFSFWSQSQQRQKNLQFFCLCFALLAIYTLGQFFFKTQLLVTNKIYFVSILLLSSLTIFWLFSKKVKIFYISLFTTLLLWTFVVLLDHAKTFDALSKGVFYLKNIKKENDKVVTNDVSSLSGFYFGSNLKYSGNLDSGKKIEELIQKEQPKYVLYTNEHNPDLEFFPSKYPFFKVLKEFSFEDRGRKFVTIVLEVSSN